MRRIDMSKISDIQDLPLPIPAFSWLGSLSPLLLVPIGLLVMIALLAPDTVLDESPLAKFFTNWMQLNLPFINRHADSTKYPQVALLVNCLMVALIPMLSLVWLIASFLNYPKLLERNRPGKRLDFKTHLFILFFGVPIFLVLIYFMVAIQGDPSWAKGFATTNRGGFALTSSAMLYLSSLVLGGWVAMFRLFIELNAKRIFK